MTASLGDIVVVLSDMLDAGHAEAYENDDGELVYRLTPEGREWYEREYGRSPDEPA